MYNNKMTNEEQDEVKEIIENTYRALFMKMLNAFALHKIITDDRGVAIDYEFVDVNTSFEEMTGLKKDIIIGKPVTAIIPDTSNTIKQTGSLGMERSHKGVEMNDLKITHLDLISGFRSMRILL